LLAKDVQKKLMDRHLERLQRRSRVCDI
jgi:hypothetical protein